MYTVKKGNLYVKDSRFAGKSSYTTNPQKAVKYPTYDEAKKNACGNEQVVKMTLEYV